MILLEFLVPKNPNNFSGLFLWPGWVYYSFKMTEYDKNLKSLFIIVNSQFSNYKTVAS